MHISICDEQLLETQPCKNKQPKHYILALQIATRDQNSSTADWGWSSHAGFVPAGSNSNTIPQSNHKFFNIIGVIHHGLKFQWLLSGVWFDSDLLAVDSQGIKQTLSKYLQVGLLNSSCQPVKFRIKLGCGKIWLAHDSCKNIGGNLIEKQEPIYKMTINESPLKYQGNLGKFTF